jgi:LacI family transcriptional regulator
MCSAPRVVLLMEPAAGYDRGVLRGIARYVRRHGPWVCFLAGEHPGVPLPIINRGAGRSTRLGRGGGGRRSSVLDLGGLGATGVIGRLGSPRVAEAVLRSRLPLIAMDLSDEQLSKGSPLRQISEIRPDSPKAGRLAAEHLLERGFRHFAFCGYPGENWSRHREAGFRERLHEAGLRCDVFRPQRCIRIPWHRELTAVTAWLKSLPKPVGLLACNDIRGRQVIEACALDGVNVPNEVAVVGVDEDHLLSEFSNPPLSSVALNAERGGYEAAELLDRMMKGRAKQRRLILVEPLGVVARLSTDVIAVEDRDVAAALRYVRDNARRAIGVQDVVRHSAVSRRALEIRFQRSLGRSIREEIQRVRLNWAKQLLTETNLSLEKIADHAGFNSLCYLSRVFHRSTGITLGQYRRDRRRP